MICCVMPAAGGGSILAAILVAVAAAEGIEWALARIWWILSAAVIIAALAVAAMVPLMRWAQRRDAQPVALWRGEVPAQLYAAPVTELPRAERPAIENHFHVHHHYAGPEPARTAIPGTAGDAITEGNHHGTVQ